MFEFLRKQRSFDELGDRLRLPIGEARKRASILVIDDDENAFPTDLMVAEGYKVTWWRELKSVRNLEEGQFDVIVLDIYGICPPGVSKNEGIGVLEHLKKVNPAQIIIAYSGRKFDLQQEKFWRLADDYLGKPSHLIDCRAKIDQLLQERFTADYYWTALAKTLTSAGVSEKQIKRLESEIVNSIDAKQQLDREKLLNLLKTSKEVLATTWIIVQIIQKFAPQ